MLLQEGLNPIQYPSINPIYFYFVEKLPGRDSVECPGKIKVQDGDKFAFLNQMAPLFNC